MHHVVPAESPGCQVLWVNALCAASAPDLHGLPIDATDANHGHLGGPGFAASGDAQLQIHRFATHQHLGGDVGAGQAALPIGVGALEVHLTQDLTAGRRDHCRPTAVGLGGNHQHIAVVVGLAADRAAGCVAVAGVAHRLGAGGSGGDDFTLRQLPVRTIGPDLRHPVGGCAADDQRSIVKAIHRLRDALPWAAASLAVNHYRSAVGAGRCARLADDLTRLSTLYLAAQCGATVSIDLFELCDQLAFVVGKAAENIAVVVGEA